MKLIAPITESRNNQPVITNYNINLMRVQAQTERTITQIQATATKLLFVHTHNSARNKFQQVLVRLGYAGLLECEQKKKKNK